MSKKIENWLAICAALLTGILSGQAADIEPRLVRPTLNAAEVIVADVVVTDAPYSADASGERDATAAVQRAIDELSKNGGGVVYMPAGNYRFDGNLILPGELSIRKKGAQE